VALTPPQVPATVTVAPGATESANGPVLTGKFTAPAQTAGGGVAGIGTDADSPAGGKRQADRNVKAGVVVAGNAGQHAAKPSVSVKAAAPSAASDDAAETASTDEEIPAAASTLEKAEHAIPAANWAVRRDRAFNKPDAERVLAEPQTSGGADKLAGDAIQLAGVQHPPAASSSAVSVAPGGAQPITAASDQAAAVPFAGVALEIAGRAQAGRSRFDIRLDPPELGRIEVRLDMDSGGQVTSHVIADKIETLDLLRRDAGELERALQQAGLKTADNGLQFTLRDQNFGGGGQDTGARADVSRLLVSDTELPALEPTAGSYGRSLQLGAGVDIRV
jgi:hypothetical protein